MNFSTLLKVKKIFVLMTACLFTAVFFSSAHSSDGTVLSIEDVTVTAAKKESVADDFPGSISVVSQAFLDEHAVADMGELTRFVPNVFLKKATSGDAFVSRGISTIDISFYSPMGLYVDDVAYPLSYMQDQHLFDVERVEILRGPQSTLYGRNSASGVINIVQAQPDNENKIRVFLETGSNRSYAGGGRICGPAVKDKLYYDVSVHSLRTDGYMENEITGDDTVSEEERIAVRGTLRWTPGSDLDISLVFDASDSDLGISNLRFENGPHASARFKTQSNEEDKADQNDAGVSFRVKYGFGSFDLTSITALRGFNRDFSMDFDRTSLALGVAEMALDQNWWSQEFRFASSRSKRFSWLIGFYARKENLDTQWRIDHISPMIASNRVTDAENEGYAAFGQSSFSVTDRLTITAGLRLDYSSVSGTQEYRNNSGSMRYGQDFSDTKVLPMAALSYEFCDNIMGYGTFSTGWLGGGADHFSATSRDTFSYDAEYTQNFEAGIKTDFFNKRLKADLSVFYTDIRDKQILEEVTGGAGLWRFSNAAAAHTRGFELDITALPLASLELFAGIGYAASKIDDWTGWAEGRAVDYSGNSLPWAPEFTSNAGAGYYAANGLYCIVDAFYAGKQYFDAANTLQEKGYALVNLKTGYKYKAFDFSIWCKNLFDEGYANKKVKMNTGQTLVEDGNPLTVGVTFNWRI